MRAEEEAILNVLKKIIRVGTVQAYYQDKDAARVKFDDKGGIISAPLKVIRRPVNVVPGQNDQAGGKTAGTSLKYDRNDSLTTEIHSHAAYVKDWVPQVNDMVVCIYVPGGDGDGFILGMVK